MKTNNEQKSIFTVKDLTEISVLVGLALVLDTFVKIPIQIAGGSVNIACVPLFIIALRHGPIKSLIAGGVAFGLLSCLIDGYGFIYYPMEYLIAFGAVSVLGIFGRLIHKLFIKDYKGKLFAILLTICMIFLAGVIRFFSASVDSYIFYHMTWTESFLYQLTYVPASTISCAIVVTLLLPTIILLGKRFKTSYLKNEKKKEEGINNN